MTAILYFIISLMEYRKPNRVKTEGDLINA